MPSASLYRNLLKSNKIYLITSDADLGPLDPTPYLSPKILHHNFNLVNILKINRKEHQLYTALSCIGGYLKDFQEMLDINLPNLVNCCNSTEIDRIYKQQQLFMPQNENTDWYVDQFLASRYLVNYVMKYDKILPKSDSDNFPSPGWSKIYTNQTEAKSFLRINRPETARTSLLEFYEKAQLFRKKNRIANLNLKFRDIHLCRFFLSNNCYYLTLSVIAESTYIKNSDIKNLNKLRNKLLNAALKNKNIGTSNTRKVLEKDEKMRQFYLKNYQVDIRQQWTDLYPEIYLNRRPGDLIVPRNSKTFTVSLQNFENGLIKIKSNNRDDLDFSYHLNSFISSLKKLRSNKKGIISSKNQTLYFITPQLSEVFENNICPFCCEI